LALLKFSDQAKSGHLLFLEPFFVFLGHLHFKINQPFARCQQMYIYTNKIFHKHTSLIFTLLGAASASIAFLIQRLSETYFPSMREVVVYFAIILFAIFGAIIGKMIYELHYMAMFDFLTKLGNRWYFNIRLTQEIERNRSGNYSVCVAAIDVDNFKQINDNYGHATGDKVLSIFADILLRFASEDDICCRLSGDEFILYFRNLTARKDLEQKAKGIIYEMNKKIANLNICIDTSVSIGIAVAPEDVILFF